MSQSLFAKSKSAALHICKCNESGLIPKDGPVREYDGTLQEIAETMEPCPRCKKGAEMARELTDLRQAQDA